MRQKILINVFLRWPNNNKSAAGRPAGLLFSPRAGEDMKEHTAREETKILIWNRHTHVCTEMNSYCRVWTYGKQSWETAGNKSEIFFLPFEKRFSCLVDIWQSSALAALGRTHLTYLYAWSLGKNSTPLLFFLFISAVLTFLLSVLAAAFFMGPSIWNEKKSCLLLSGVQLTIAIVSLGGLH